MIFKSLFVFLLDVKDAELVIFSEAEIKKVKQELYVFAKGVNTMNVKVRESAKRLREIADDLDKVWKDCKTASAVGNASALVGDVMTVAGGVATAMVAGPATPLLIAGAALGGAGACVNLGARCHESTSNSSRIWEADAAVKKASSHLADVKKQIRMLKDGKDRLRLYFVAELAATMLGANHLAVTLIKDCMRSDLLTKVLNEVSIKAVKELALKLGVKEVTTATAREIVESTPRNALSVGTVTKGAKHIATEAASKSGAVAIRKGGSKAASKAGKEFMKKGSRAVDKVTTETAGKAAAKEAGGIIAGVGAFFMVLDAIDLHFTVRDIIENKGSDASRSLREKADELEALVSV